jgi:hypothetical protein
MSSVAAEDQIARLKQDGWCVVENVVPESDVETVKRAVEASESLGIKLQGVGIGERAERLLVIAIIGIVGGIFQMTEFMEYAIYIVIVISGITLIQRIIVTTKKLNE